jgi:hypothetical protein
MPKEGQKSDPKRISMSTPSRRAEEIGEFEELLKLDPQQVKSIRVMGSAKPTAQLMHIIVPRRDVERGATQMTLSALSVLLTDGETARQFQNRVVLSFQGYDDDPRGLFQIETVCEFLRKLNKEWYAWFFFMTKDLELSPIAVIALCCCPRYTVLSSSGLFIPQFDDLKKFLWFQFGALRAHCQIYGLSKEQTEAEVEAVVEYFMKIGWVRGCDMPCLTVHSAKTRRSVEVMTSGG